MNENDTPILEFVDVDVQLGKNLVLSKINLKVYKGEYIGLIGKNGSGKSTLLRTALGIIKPLHGTVKYYGSALNRRHFERIGYVPQMHPINRHFPATVSDVVEMGLYKAPRRMKLTKKEKQNKIMLALHKVKLENYINRPFGHLSGGEQQKALLAHALVREPEILLLDEPTSALDFTMTKDFLKLLNELNHKYGITLIVIQ
ncbi:MAG: metal ABC transporter ATP-binding protein, partial [Promethearchaeota archaeon]